jgi:ABC-type Na+ efflux pump permease subunit
MKNKFRGWNTVFNFTFRQSTKGPGFKVVTVLVALVIIAAAVLINVLSAKPEKNNIPEVSPVKKVCVLDNSGLQPTSYRELNPLFSQKQYAHIEFETITNQSREDVIKTAAADSPKTIAAVISTVDSGYSIEIIVPAESAISKSEAELLVAPMTAAFETNKLLQSGLTEEQLTAALKPVITSFGDIGEDTNGIAFAIKMIAPMIFGLMLYMMLILYGQTISKSVSTEKTSKLMETLLTSVHPYALITGKVLAVSTMAILQFVTWLIAIFAGLYLGNTVAHSMYPEYESTVITIINFLKDNIGETAFTLPAVILSIIAFCIGFLFYCVIAGLAGCMVSKPEDVASTQGIFQFPVMISWLVCYLSPVMGNESLQIVTRYIPFTAPFCIPVDILTGTIGLGEGLITTLLLLLFTLVVIMLSGRIYKGLILYNGQKVSLKMIGNVIKANK